MQVNLDSSRCQITVMETMDKEVLQVPGPTPIPEKVLQAMGSNLMYHRGEEFGRILKETLNLLRKVFGTEGDVFILSSSGRGAMEAVLVNAFSPGDKVLVLVNGRFGDIFSEIAESFDLRVETLKFPWGSPVDVWQVEDRVRKDSEIKGVLCIHCETSTGVINDIKAVGDITARYNILSVIDAVSSAGGIDLRMDEWNLDFVLTGSQKALMTPPGLGIVAVSQRGWEAVKKSSHHRFYWDLRRYKEFQDKQLTQTPFTSPVSLICGLREALRIMEEEGFDAVIKRHAAVAWEFRKNVREIGLEMFPQKDEWSSNTMSAVKCPSDIDSSIIVREMLENYHIRIASGLGELKNRVVRIGHMGTQAQSNHMRTVALALSEVLHTVKGN